MMNFSEQIKNIRKQQKLTQEAFAQALGVTRQAVSNWENDRNLPDIQMLVTMHEVFHISLDQLILGGNDMNNMTEKLIRDGSQMRLARFNAISTCVGGALFILGAACLGIKAASVEYIDAAGVLHENFFLLPIAFLFFFGGFVTFLATGMRNVVSLLRDKTDAGRKNRMTFLIVSIAVVALCVVLLGLLKMANG